MVVSNASALEVPFRVRADSSGVSFPPHSPTTRFFRGKLGTRPDLKKLRSPCDLPGFFSYSTQPRNVTIIHQQTMVPKCHRHVLVLALALLQHCCSCDPQLTLFSFHWCSIQYTLGHSTWQQLGNMLCTPCSWPLLKLSMLGPLSAKMVRWLQIITQGHATYKSKGVLFLQFLPKRPWIP